MHFDERRRCGDDGGRKECAILDNVHLLPGGDLHGHDGCEWEEWLMRRGFGQGVARAGD